MDIQNNIPNGIFVNFWKIYFQFSVLDKIWGKLPGGDELTLKDI